ncbi:uncharacterized protein DUF2587 [Ilumatobacter fluminis]|uniref:Bacterial proteasome activator n=1 Tax=Ilumatobacter fluminis TaxID=467091 RepID=A0A4R7HYP1_9ACTN|nr:proteasome activator [Ilumatobacter fluminis]TDT16231.1 uncharacterized protein DUF2587 [Ilumatobacter fluminis]
MTDTNTTPDTPTTEPADETSDAAGTNGADGVERGELVGVRDGEGGDDGDESGDVEPSGAITEPAKVMRIGSMVKQLLDEVRDMELDEPSRERLAEIYERSVVELSEALSPDLQEELRMLALPFDEDTVPTEPELRIAKAQLVGWLEGLFHGIQASLVAQQMAARQQLEQMRQIGPGGQPQPGQPMPGQPGQPGQGLPPQSDRPGTYI